MERIHISDITDIKEDKIYYRNVRGDIVYIELEPCANRYEATHSTVDNGDPKVRCVGERLFGEYAYYELYTAGKTQIYLNLKTSKLKRFISKIVGWNFFAKEFQQFYSIQKRLNSNGWTTLDLS